MISTPIGGYRIQIQFQLSQRSSETAERCATPLPVAAVRLCFRYATDDLRIIARLLDLGQLGDDQAPAEGNAMAGKDFLVLDIVFREIQCHRLEAVTRHRKAD